jgi:N-methylhydantoinase A
LLPRQALGGQKHAFGPALLEDPTSTLYLPAGWTARCDDNDNTILERQ